MITSESIVKISAALALAQAQIKNAAKDGKNKHLNNWYATIESVLEVARPALASAKLALFQSPEWRGATTVLVSRLIHESGEFFESEHPLILGKNDMQSLKSAVTYMRRTSACAMLAIAEADDDDDDGNDAVAQAPQSRPAPKPIQNYAPGASSPTPSLADDLDRLIHNFSKIGVSRKQIQAKYGIDTITALTHEQIADLNRIGASIQSRKSNVVEHFGAPSV